MLFCGPITNQKLCVGKVYDLLYRYKYENMLKYYYAY